MRWALNMDHSTSKTMIFTAPSGQRPPAKVPERQTQSESEEISKLPSCRFPSKRYPQKRTHNCPPQLFWKVVKTQQGHPKMINSITRLYIDVCVGV